MQNDPPITTTEKRQPSFGISSLLVSLRRWDWLTFGLFCLCYVVLGAALLMPAGWALAGAALLVLALTLHSSLSHEILHGHPFPSETANTALALVQPGLFVPYLRFKRLHLAHHRDALLTDPYDDPETNFLDPVVWNALPQWKRVLLHFNNTLLGRMTVGPALGQLYFMRADLERARRGERQVIWDWVAHLPGVVFVLVLVSISDLPMWLYLLACYAALSILRIRTFLEHQAHERASGRSVIIEDSGLLAFLFLNNNLHVVHHMHPAVSWYRLPALYQRHKARYLRRNQGYVYRSYAEIFRLYFLRVKDPVAHPLWQDRTD